MINVKLRKLKSKIMVSRGGQEFINDYPGAMLTYPESELLTLKQKPKSISGRRRWNNKNAAVMRHHQIRFKSMVKQFLPKFQEGGIIENNQSH